MRPCERARSTGRRRRASEILRHTRAAQVGFDEHDGVAGLGEHQSQVDGRGGLALTGQRAGDDDRARRVVDLEELQVGPHLAVGLGVAAVGFREDDRRLFVTGLVERDHTHHTGAGEILDGVAVLDGVVEAVAQHREGDTEQQTDGQTQRDVPRGLRRHRRRRRGRVLLDHHAGRGRAAVLGGLQFACHDDELVRQRVREVAGALGRLVGDGGVDEHRVGGRRGGHLAGEIDGRHLAESELVEGALREGGALEQFGVGGDSLLGEQVALIDLLHRRARRGGHEQACLGFVLGRGQQGGAESGKHRHHRRDGDDLPPRLQNSQVIMYFHQGVSLVAVTLRAHPAGAVWGSSWRSSTLSSTGRSHAPRPDRPVPSA